MSFPTFEDCDHDQDNNFLFPFDDSYNNSWSLDLQEDGILLPPETERSVPSHEPMDSAAAAQPCADKGLAGKRLINTKISERNRKIRHLNIAEKMVAQHSAEEGSSTAKKLDHNAKERVRRIRLNASYLALRSLLPNSRRSKKKSSAPALIDRVLEYIPDLENEIEKLTLKKNTMQSINQNPELELRSTTVSVNEVRKGEVIVQVCMGRDGNNNVFSNLIQNVEEEGMCIASASTLDVCDDRICYHLHIQMKEGSFGANYIAEIRDKVISCLPSFIAMEFQR